MTVAPAATHCSRLRSSFLPTACMSQHPPVRVRAWCTDPLRSPSASADGRLRLAAINRGHRQLFPRRPAPRPPRPPSQARRRRRRSFGRAAQSSRSPSSLAISSSSTVTRPEVAAAAEAGALHADSRLPQDGHSSASKYSSRIRLRTTGPARGREVGLPTFRAPEGHAELGGLLLDRRVRPLERLSAAAAAEHWREDPERLELGRGPRPHELSFTRRLMNLRARVCRAGVLMPSQGSVSKPPAARPSASRVVGGAEGLEDEGSRDEGLSEAVECDAWRTLGIGSAHPGYPPCHTPKTAHRLEYPGHRTLRLECDVRRTLQA